MTGKGRLWDPDEYFIVCANILGSHYGTTGPLSAKPGGGKYYRSFPDITIRDMVNAHILLRKHLQIEKIHTVTGGSIGSFQTLEWGIMEPDVIENLVIIAGSAKVTAWVAGLNESQRMAIRADLSFFDDTDDGGKEGMKAARAMALLSYRNHYAYNKTQPVSDEDSPNDLKAISYQQYQGEKLARRFNAYSYYTLSKAMDSHNPGRGRGGLVKALRQIKARTLIIGIDTDILFPVEEQVFLMQNIPEASLSIISSGYGHDGFLLEFEKLERQIKKFYKEQLAPAGR